MPIRQALTALNKQKKISKVGDKINRALRDFIIDKNHIFEQLETKDQKAFPRKETRTMAELKATKAA